MNDDIKYSGYVSVYRSLMGWRWYKNKNVKILFLHCLLAANWTDGEYEDIKVPTGSFVTSLSHLAFDCGLTIKETRSALKKLEKTQEVARTSTSKYTVITVLNYNRYQKVGKQRANEGQSLGKRGANEGQQYNNNNNNNKNKKEKEKDSLPPGAVVDEYGTISYVNWDDVEDE